MKKGTQTNHVVLSSIMPTQEARAIRDLAVEQGRTVSLLIRDALRWRLLAAGTGKPSK